MEGNGIIIVEGRTVCFGMKAAEMFGENLNAIEQQYGKTSQWDIFVCLLHSGLMNEDYNERKPFTTFKEASLFADSLDKDTRDSIWTCYEQSKPGQSINKALSDIVGQKKSDEEILNQQTGQQSGSTPQKMESVTVTSQD